MILILSMGTFQEWKYSCSVFVQHAWLSVLLQGFSNRMHIGPHLQCYWSIFRTFVLCNCRLSGRDCLSSCSTLMTLQRATNLVERWPDEDVSLGVSVSFRRPCGRQPEHRNQDHLSVHAVRFVVKISRGMRGHLCGNKHLFSFNILPFIQFFLPLFICQLLLFSDATLAVHWCLCQYMYDSYFSLPPYPFTKTKWRAFPSYLSTVACISPLWCPSN